MSQITVISGTNRPNSNSEKVAMFIYKQLQARNENVKFLSLENLPRDIAFGEMFGSRTDGYNALVKEYVEDAHKYIFVIPEYNGGFPGILKTFIDSIQPKTLHNKKAGLIGVASGRAGNLRGLDNFTNVLNYLKVNVYHHKTPISSVDKILDTAGVPDENTRKDLDLLIDGFLTF